MQLFQMSSSSLYSNSAIEQILECPICMDTFVKPKVLPCQHSFCLNCIHRSYTDNVLLSEKYKLLCPICREIYQLKAPKSYRSLKSEDLDCRLQNHFVLNALLDAKQQALENSNKNKTRKASVKRNFSVYVKNKPRPTLVTLKCATCRFDRKWQCVTCDGGFCHECVVDHFDTKPDHEIFDLESQILCESNKTAATPGVSPIAAATPTTSDAKSVVISTDAVNICKNSKTIVNSRDICAPTKTPIWDVQVEQLVRSSNCITKAAVIDSANGRLWAQFSRQFREPFVATSDELSAVCDHFRAASRLLTEGVTLERFKYVVTLCEKNIIFGKFNGAGVFALKTGRAILIVLFNGDICESAVVRQSIEKAASYLKDIHY